MTNEEWREQVRLAVLLEGAPFQFAYTQPQSPHYYTLKKKWAAGEAPYVWAGQMIWKHGRKETFGGRNYKIWVGNGFKYWTGRQPGDSHPPISIETCCKGMLLNRKHLLLPARHRLGPPRLMPEYSPTPDDKSQLQAAVAYLVVDRLPSSGDLGRVLDIGCGTGSLLDQYPVSPAQYVGIDPSPGMLIEFQRRHPRYANSVRCSAFGDFFDGAGFDTIVGLLGSPSHVEPEAFDRLRWMLRPGGRAFLMFYRRGYQSLAYEMMQPPAAVDGRALSIPLVYAPPEWLHPQQWSDAYDVGEYRVVGQ